MDPALTVAHLRATPTLLRELSRDCTAEQAWTPATPGAWSIGEVVRHLLEGDRDTFLPRLRRMVGETRPVFDKARPSGGDRSDLKTLLDAFEAAREQALKVLGALDGAGWQREGVSGSLGTVTIARYAGIMADHDTEHLQQIHDVRVALGLPPRRTEARLALPLPALVAALRATPARLAQLAEGVSSGQLRHRPKEGEWCMKEVMAHLLHVETTLFLPRMRRMIGEQQPVFEPFSPQAWAKERDHRLGDFAEDLAAFNRARAETLAFLEALAPGAGERLGLSGFFGPVTLAQYATHIVDHDLEHLAQMTDCRVVALNQG